MAKPIHHAIDIYGGDLWIAVTRKQWRKIADVIPLGDEPDSAGSSTFAVFHPDDGSMHRPTLVMWIDRKMHTGPGELVNTIAHEAAHGASQLLDHIGHTLVATDEPHAYLTGWLAERLWDACG